MGIQKYLSWEKEAQTAVSQASWPGNGTTTLMISNSLIVLKVRYFWSGKGVGVLNKKKSDRYLVGSEGGRGRWGTPTMALHIRVQHRE